MENINKRRLFIGSCLALVVTSMTFAIRAKIENVFRTQYGLSAEEIGWAFGPAFWGFTVAMFAGGLIIDVVKTKSIIWLAFILHLIGIIILLMAQDAYMLFFSNVFIGLGNGSVEAACNPLIATVYPDKKTKMLNKFHVWFPGGMIIGSILGWFLMEQIHLPWEILVTSLFIPLLIYGVLFFGQKIPETERVSSGVTYKDMLKNVSAPYTIIILITAMIVIASLPNFNIDFSSTITYIVLAVIIIGIVVEGLVVNKISLLFPFILFCMFLTASTELGTNQWINALLEKDIDPLIVLAIISGIMAVGRFFAGPLVHRLNPPGVLLGSAIISVGGLYWLSIASGPAMTLIAAIVFAIGVCYFWPTMLGFVAEYIPKSGALGLSIMGGAGMVATSLVLPIMGGSIETAGPQMTLRYMAILPLILVVAFIFLNIHMKNKKHPAEE